MPRPAKYTEADKPVSVTIRIPRDLYDAAQSRASLRRTNLTEVLLDGLRISLETPTDPREILLSNDNAVMQDLERLIDARIAAQLAEYTLDKAQTAFAQSTPAHVPQEASSAPLAQGSNAVMLEHAPDYDTAKYVLGKLCPHSHDHAGTGQSLLYRRNKRCVECDNESARAKRKAKKSA